MPPVYLSDYAEELKAIGPESFGRLYPHPVLIVLGLSGKLREKKSSGTVIAEASDTLLEGSLVGRVFPVVKAKFSPPGPVMVGRTSDNDVAIPEYSISKRHCFLAVVGDEIRLTDPGSTNGTQVNGVPLKPRKPVPLVGGEHVSLGRFVLLFERVQDFIKHLQARP